MRLRSGADLNDQASLSQVTRPTRAPAAAEPVVARHPLLALQRRIGNQAVQRLVRGGAIPAAMLTGQPSTLGNQTVPRSSLDQLPPPTLMPTAPAKNARLGTATAQTETLTGVISRILSDQGIMERGEQIEKNNASAPTAGANLWLFQGEKSTTKLYIIGTMHASILDKMTKGKALVQWLTDTKFDEVYSELEENGSTDPNELLEAFKTLEMDDKAFHEKESLSLKKAEHFKRLARIYLTKLTLDVVYAALASKGKGSKALESQESRNAIRKEYAEKSTTNKVEQSLPNENNVVDQWVTQGDERSLWAKHAEFVKKGIDLQDIESRNQSWTANVKPGLYHPDQTVLWIVGASHLPGLIIDLGNNGWKAVSVQP